MKGMPSPSTSNPALLAVFAGFGVHHRTDLPDWSPSPRKVAVMIPDSCAKCTSFGPGPTLSLGPGPVTMRDLPCQRPFLWRVTVAAERKAIVRHGFFPVSRYFPQNQIFPHSLGDWPAMEVKVRLKTEGDEKPQLAEISAIFIPGLSAIRRLASSIL